MVMQVEFVSPESVLYSGEATTVLTRTRGGGDIAFMEGHEPFIASLIPSEVRVTEEGDSYRSFVVRGGFVSVTGTSVTVLSDAAVPVEELVKSEAEKDLKEALLALEEDPDDPYHLADKVWATVQLAALEGVS